MIYLCSTGSSVRIFKCGVCTPDSPFKKVVCSFGILISLVGAVGSLSS